MSIDLSSNIDEDFPDPFSEISTTNIDINSSQDAFPEQNPDPMFLNSIPEGLPSIANDDSSNSLDN
jgi:hypothetical protein